MGYTWDWSVIAENADIFVLGIFTTIVLAVITMALSLPGGLALALFRLRGPAAVRWLTTGYVEFFRLTPFLMQLFWIYFGLPYLLGISLDPFIAAVLTLTLNVSAFNSEIFRSGIVSVGSDQEQAAIALGMSTRQALRRVVLPQAVRRVIPPLGNQWVAMFQSTSLVAFISVGELMYQSLVLRAGTYRSLEILTATALIYLIVSYPQAKVVDHLYARMKTSAI